MRNGDYQQNHTVTGNIFQGGGGGGCQLFVPLPPPPPPNCPLFPVLFLSLLSQLLSLSQPPLNCLHILFLGLSQLFPLSRPPMNCPPFPVLIFSLPPPSFSLCPDPPWTVHPFLFSYFVSLPPLPAFPFVPTPPGTVHPFLFSYLFLCLSPELCLCCFVALISQFCFSDPHTPFFFEFCSQPHFHFCFQMFIWSHPGSHPFRLCPCHV